MCVKEQLGWSKTLARVSRLERVRSISLDHINTQLLINDHTCIFIRFSAEHLLYIFSKQSKETALSVYFIISVCTLQVVSSFHQFSSLTIKAKNADLCRPWQAVPRVRLRWCNVVAPLCTFSMSRGSSLKR